MRNRSTTDHTTLYKWFAWKVMFRALLLLWLLMAVFIFQYRGVIRYAILSNSPSSEQQQQQYDPSISNSSSEQQQQQYDPISRSSSEQQQHYDLISRSFSEQQQQLPSPLRTTTTSLSQTSLVNVVGLAEPTVRVGQQEQQLRQLLDPKYDDHDIVVWRRRMLKGSGTPSSPSDMNHGASKS